MDTTTTGDRQSWTLRARYLSQLLGADGLMVLLDRGGGSTVYAAHNVAVDAERDICRAASPSMRDGSFETIAGPVRLADARIASQLCVAPLRWKGAVVGSVTAARVSEPWAPSDHVALARTADLVALELAETYARLWWQNAAEASRRRLQLIETIRQELGAATESSTMIDAFTRRVAELCGGGVSVMLLDDSQHLVVRAAIGPHERRVRDARRRLGEGISGWVAQHGEPLRLVGPVTDPRFNGIDPTIDESFVVPVRAADRVLGVVAARSQHRAQSDAGERLEELCFIASELGRQLSRTQELTARSELLARLENDRRDAIAMYDLARLAGIGADPDGDLGAAADLVARAFGHDEVAIWTVQDDRLALRASVGFGDLTPGDIDLRSEDICAQVLAEGRPTLLPETAWVGRRLGSARTRIIVPIGVSGENAALLLVGRRQMDYEPFDVSLAATIADVLSSLVRREIATRRAERSAIEHEQAIERIRTEFAEEMSHVVLVLDVCQRLLRRDHDLPSELASAARDARKILSRFDPRYADAETRASSLSLPGASPGAERPALAAPLVAV